MARNNSYSKGFPYDPISLQPIGQDAIFALDGNNNFVPVGVLNPMPVRETSKTSVSTMIGPFGETLVGYKRDDVSVNWQYDVINTEYDCKTPVLTGDGVATVVNSLLKVSSAATGTANVESRDTVRYLPGHSGFIDFTLRVTGSTGVVRSGARDEDDGFYIKYDIDLATWYLGYRRGVGNDIEEVFDGSILTPSAVNIFRIWWGYLGVASPVLMTKQGDWQFLKTLETEGVLETTHVLRPNFPMFIEAENGASGEAGSWNAGTIGNGSATKGNRSFAFPNTPLVNGTTLESGSMTLTSTNVGTVVIVNLKDTFQGKNNNVKLRLLRWSCTVIPPSTGDGEVLFQLISNPTLSGSPTYVDVNAVSSTARVDHTAGSGSSVNYSSGGIVLLQQQVFYAAGQGSSTPVTSLSNEDAERLGLIGYPKDSFCVVAKDRDGNTVTVRTELIWEEEF